MTNILPTDGFIRSNDNPGALINVDNRALQAYKHRREREMSKQDEINSLKQELEDMKSLLSQVLEKLK
ncbi:hypothetical protein UFOVP247_106 [uncultured Caudovirales phage]|uniref:Uncharacterized protein n=1 Tax=uncultured Caudovirales phage TaxID=2100421 RepID=A0A6J7WTW2_9CAUD|nr:hypothetical protein UFOVP247_106 [uncultured Caudovirales phage]